MASASSNKWSEIVQGYYPEALSRTHIVPPVHFNRVPYVVGTVPGTSKKALVHPRPEPPTTPPPPPVRPSSAPLQPPSPQSPQVLWHPEPLGPPETVQENDFRDDAAQARIIRNLEELGKSRQEVMFILSQFNLEDFLNKCKDGLGHLPALPRGDFDVLIIHRHHGILIGEAKSVGHNRADLKMTEAQFDASVMKRVVKSLTQLDKLQKVAQDMVADIAPDLPVRTALFLPNVQRSQLRRILTADRQLEQDACRRLAVTTGEEAAQVCCCQDDVSGRDSWWDVTPAVISELSRWWEIRMDSVDRSMTDSMYLNIVARFVGPASSVHVFCCTPPRVEVRTEGEAVAELGRRLSCLVLTPEQWDLMSQRLPLVFLTGPPGTGKTVVLVLMGVSWLQSGIDTYVVSTHPGTFAISTMIARQLKQTAAPPTSTGRMHLCVYDFVNDGLAHARALRELTVAARGGAGIIIDEADFNDRRSLGRNIHSLVAHLIREVPGLRLWCAGLFYDASPPQGLQTQVLTTPLRSAPAILREVRPTLGRFVGLVHDYSDNDIPAPGDGPSVQHLRHEGDAHTGQWPVECVQCGREVAAELRRLGVAISGSGIFYRDVFVITRGDELEDGEEDDAGEVTSEASGVVRGLREEGMPVCVLGVGDFRRDRYSWEQEMEDSGTGTTDRITAVYFGFVPGLERKVVVWLPGRMQGDDERTDEDVDDTDRLKLVTRCTTQLVVVDRPCLL